MPRIPPPAGDFGTLDQSSADEPPVQLTADDRPPDPPGFALKEEVGRGGMGVVYRAHDLTLDRDVAVKLLRPTAPADGPSARRFAAEAKITGRLQHPGVPPVYHVGHLADGRPFLAMKLVRGKTLSALLKDGTDPGKLVAVFEKMCDAVGFAHAHGVIHRDLKPANVMVGTFGEVQVMDWGLAKYLAAHLLPDADEVDLGGESPSAGPRSESRSIQTDETRAGSVMGTPAYMAPEQATGAVDKMDTRTDVFGLGAILCTLLTGQPPFVGEDVGSTHLLAARADLADAHARLDGCRADPELVALCKRCLAADPADRPADGGTVAAAVAAQRAAADDRARRAETAAAVGRGRRRAIAVAGGVVSFVLAAGAAVSGWQAVRAIHAEKATAAQLHLTREAEAEARRSAELAREAEQVAVIESERAKVEGDRAKREGEKAKAEEAKAKASEGRARSAEAEARQSAELARVAERVAVTEGERARQEEGKARAAAALASRREKEAVEAAADTQAFSDFLTGKILAAARPAGQQGGVGKDVKLSEALRAAEVDLEKQFAGRPKAEAAARHALGVTWRNLGDYDRAATHLSRAVELRRAALPANHRDTLTSVSSLSVLHQLKGDPAAAEKLAREALAGRRATLPPTDRDVFTSINNLALLLRMKGDTAAAEPLLIEVVAGRRETLGGTAPETLAGVANLATLYVQTGDLAKAEPLLVEAAAGLRAAGDASPDALTVFHNLAELYTRQRRYEAAEPLHRQAVAGARAALPEGHPTTAVYQSGLGRMLRAKGDLAGAEPHLLAAHATLKGQSAYRSQVREVVQALAEVCAATNRPAEAAAWRAELAALK